MVESADLVITCGAVFTDYNTAGWTALIVSSKLIQAGLNSVNVCGTLYSNILLEDFITAFVPHAVKKDTSTINFQRYVSKEATIELTPHIKPRQLSTGDIKSALQSCIGEDTDLIVENGNSWFLSQELILPDGAKYHIQMQVTIPIKNQVNLVANLVCLVWINWMGTRSSFRNCSSERNIEGSHCSYWWAPFVNKYYDIIQTHYRRWSFSDGYAGVSHYYSERF